MVRAAGWLSVICGVVGVLVGLAAIAGVWVVRVQVDAQVVSLTEDLEGWVGRAESMLAEVESRLAGVKGRLHLVRIVDGTRESLDVLKDAVVAPFCGIGNPLGFRRTLEALGASVSTVGVLQLDDHQAFSEEVFRKQIDPFLRASKEAGATLALCTQKDAVKLRAVADRIEADLPILELRVEFTVTKGEKELREAITAALVK
jgi:tetraacyldisaccharide-1-P 4'-kinase